MRECRYCAEVHGTSLLCDPARRVLDALYARGQQFDMPSVEFPEPVADAGAFGDGTTLCRQIVVKAALATVAGVWRPVLIFTGQDITGRPLPEWVYPGDDETHRKVAALVAEMAEMAIRRAREQRARSGAAGDQQ